MRHNVRTDLTGTMRRRGDPDSPLCPASAQVGRVTMQCDLPNRDGAHTRGITDGLLHQSEYRNATTRILLQWEGQP